MQFTPKDLTKVNEHSLIAELCGRLKQQTGISFRPAVFPSNDLSSSSCTAQLSFMHNGQELKLAYDLPIGELGGALTERLLTVIARELSAQLLEQAMISQPEPVWSWERLLTVGQEENWDENTFEAKASEYALPELTLGLPVLIRFQNGQSDIIQVVHNLLPECIIFWVRPQEIFLLTSVNLKKPKLLAWGETLVQDIHAMLAEELGVLATVLVGSPLEKRPWLGYAELQDLVVTHRRFFRGEPGLVAWHQGLAGLLAEISQHKISHYQAEVFREQLSPELTETLEAYLRHGLSATETARALYIHRNTLVYRLDRITELTGYNPRDFEDAVYLYLALWFQERVHE